MNEVVDKIASSCRQLADRGAPIEEVVAHLHQHGMTLIQSIKTAMEIFGIPLSDAKALVSAHPVWRDVVAAALPLHEEIEKELREER